MSDLAKVLKGAFTQPLGRPAETDPLARCANALEKIWHVVFVWLVLFPIIGLVVAGFVAWANRYASGG